MSLMLCGTVPSLASAEANSVAHVAQGHASATTVRNIPKCAGIEWQRVSSSQVRIWAPGYVINDYLYDPIEYGLVWVTVFTPAGVLRHEGAFCRGSDMV